MTINVAIRHQTNYRFDRTVDIMPHIVRLRPAPHCRTIITHYALAVEPDSHYIHWQQDPFANHVARLVFRQPADSLHFIVDLTARIQHFNPFDFFIEDNAASFPFQYDERLHKALSLYLEVTDQSPALADWVAAADTQSRSTIEFLIDENRRTHELIDYVIRHESGVMTCAEVLASGRGSCRDSSWLLMQSLRSLGIAARFVSGYLIQVQTDDNGKPAKLVQESDYSELHAWVEVFLPGAGWIGLDPTSGMLANAGHIPLACTADPADAAPISGSTGICEVEFSYRNELVHL